MTNNISKWVQRAKPWIILCGPSSSINLVLKCSVEHSKARTHTHTAAQYFCYEQQHTASQLECITRKHCSQHNIQQQTSHWVKFLQSSQETNVLQQSAWKKTKKYRMYTYVSVWEIKVKNMTDLTQRESLKPPTDCGWSLPSRLEHWEINGSMEVISAMPQYPYGRNDKPKSTSIVVTVTECVCLDDHWITAEGTFHRYLLAIDLDLYWTLSFWP